MHNPVRVDCLDTAHHTLPSGRLIVDNFAQGGFAAPIDLASGTIYGPAAQKNKCYGAIWIGKASRQWSKVQRLSLPMWTEVVDLARRAHQAFRAPPFIGWDIAILQDGPVLVEGNVIWDPDLILLIHGLALTDTQFIPCYNYHFSNSMR